ncbi:hypothetical protein CKO25_02010 [Thiocapsa imhoffii]|uniref:Uncharacterized protein n=1 Tax=Thiocapsa imhoffii TaxID=382777 RepID=A0A9X0WFB0_9GAMM|nr:hypothetical protein [Thiocapsa imhoffii]
MVPTLQGLSSLLDRFGLTLEIGDTTGPIPGSYWGDVEAGLIGDRLHASALTPLHSVLHEACHWICLDAPRRCHLHTDAGGDDAEENAVCYLQVLLADWVPGLGRTRLFADMDAWGYHFRLGSARAWFEDDAEDARAWLVRHGIIMPNGHPTWHVRDDPRALVTKTVAGVQP